MTLHFDLICLLGKSASLVTAFFLEGEAVFISWDMKSASGNVH